MSAILPINLDDLLRCRSVESARVEFKSGWNPQTTGYQALKTIEPDHFSPGAAVPAMPARNRRIGEFFSELKLAERRLTGVPKIFEAMARNGSPPPRFDFDEGRTWFRATLPVHPGESATS